MSVYLIVDISLRDAQRYEEYKQSVPRLIEKHGGEYLVRGGEHEVLEGDWVPQRLVIFRFPDRRSVQDLFSDPEYKPLRELRHEVADSNIVAVDGL